MTDERVDTLLREAGERWRAGNDEAVTVDFSALGTAVEPDLIPVIPDASELRPRGRRRIAWIATALGLAAAVVAALLAVHTAGSPDRPRPADGSVQLAGIDWRLVAMADAHGRPLSVVAPAQLRIDGGVLDATDGCTSLSGPVTVRGGEIVPGAIAVAAVGCANGSSGFGAEVAHLQALLDGGHALRWAVAGDRLTLSGPAGTLVYGAHRPVTDPATLVGRSWTATMIAGPSSTGVAATPAAPVTLTFSVGGGFSVTHRCYWWRGDAALGSGTARFEGRTVPHSCPAGGVPRDDALVDSILTGAVRWSITDGSLTISKPGVGALVFTSPRAVTVTDPGALTGSLWSHDRGAGRTPLTIRFDGRGGYTASDGCRTMSGRAETAAGRMTLRPTGPATACATTDVFPDGPITWSIRGDTLTLQTAGGTPLVFVRRR